MHQDSNLALLILVIVACVVLGPKSIRELGQQLAEGISNFKNGGGSGTPPHPIPGNDSRVLNRKTRNPDKAKPGE